MLISIVSPCFNEVDNVEACHDAVSRIFRTELASYDWEHIFADNASTDGTVDVLRRIAATDKHVRVIVNARNYGPFRSTFNALRFCRGDAILVMLPVDLQDPPELIPEFVKRWEAGYKVVYGIRKIRQESLLLRSLRRVYYATVKKLANIDIMANVAEFQLIDRSVLDALLQFDDYHPYIRGMIANCGFKSTGIEYTWRARRQGLSKNNIFHLIDQGVNGLISVSNVPIRIATTLGILLSICSFAYAFVQLAINLLAEGPLPPPGTPTLIVAMFFFFGIVLFFQGLIGEYVAAVHAQVRHQGIVVVQERINFDAEPPGPSSEGHRVMPAKRP